MLIKSYKERRRRSLHNQQCILSFIRDVNYTNANNLSVHLRLSKSATYKYLCKLVEKNLLRKHFIQELGLSIFGLTETGILMSWDEEERIEPRNAFQPSRTNASFVLHELQLQKAMIFAQQAGFRNWQPGHLIKEQLAKRPDAIVTNKKGEVFACEYERHSKSIKRLMVIISTYLQEIKRGRYDYVVYIAPDQNLASRLKRLFHSIERVPVNGVMVPLSQKHHSRFKFYSLEGGWPHTETGGG